VSLTCPSTSCEEYRTILVDPPWMETGGGRIKRGADRHYPVLSTPEIIAAILRCELFRPAPSAHLYLWVTNNFLPEGLLVVQALRFCYKTLLTWAKDRFGLGRYFRGQTEHLIFATRGRHLPAKVRNQSTLIYARRGRHSAKPEESYTLIESASPGPYLELFARTKRPGWDCWGEEITNSSRLFMAS
jgi:N6-adenosine-specific RNA methylase IME4